MTAYRHAGTFWPANAGGEHPNVETILALPGSASLIFIVADSARYWWRQVKARADLAVWRGLPRPDRLPAMLGWDAKKVAAECVNLWDEAPHSGTEWFTPLNELQLAKESGEDWKGYADMAARLSRLRPALRAEFGKRGQDVRLLFPAWVPGDDLERADEWMDEAMQWDGIRLHAYDNAIAVRSRYWSYRTELIARYGDAGRAVPLLVDETNANHTGADEYAMVLANAEICRDDPACLGFAWYIWETRNPGEEDLSIWGNDERLALFLNPPALAPVPPPEPEPEPMPELPRGIDVASYQGYPDWPAVAAAGYAFAFTKVTEDTGYLNPTFGHNWRGIKAAGMARGAYHFARPGINDALAEADYFLDQIDAAGGLETSDLLALDMEAGSGDLGGWCVAFVNRVVERAGFRPLIYTGAWFSVPHNLGSYPELAECGLWLAAYQSQMPSAPEPWLSAGAPVAFWQYSDAGQVPGIVGNVDLDVFNGDVSRIPLYGKPAAPEPVPSGYSVGQGILDRMAALSDSPASDELYHNDQWSECLGMSGRTYRYLKATNTVYVYEPAA